jgi:3-carboxy-cis,cis-muconate cycloisomerase
VAAACAGLDVDAATIAALGAEAAGSGTPVVPLVQLLRAAVPDSAAHAVHVGATSQDIVDSAAMLVAHRALGPLLADLRAAADACAAIADRHRETLVTGRTLLQQALPTSFGLVARAGSPAWTTPGAGSPRSARTDSPLSSVVRWARSPAMGTRASRCSARSRPNSA